MLELFIFGMIIGIANIIPGVSGGTMAVILGVYDKMIACVSNLRTKWKESLLFLAPIGAGGLIGIFLFSKIIEYTLAHFNMATNMVFVGLIIGSVPMIFKNVTAEKMKLSNGIVFVLCFALMIFMKVVQPDESANTVLTTLTVTSFIQLFLVSVVSAGAMIIPGISGSFVMLLLGMYTTVLAAISDISTALFLCIDILKGDASAFDALLHSSVWLLIPVGLGCIVGIFGCAKIIEILFKKFKGQTYSGILGFMLGSIIVIFPAVMLSLELFISVVLLLGAAYTAYRFSTK